MAERNEMHTTMDADLSSSSLLTYLNVAERLRLMAMIANSTQIARQLQEIADTYEKLAGLCSRFEGLRAKLSITGPILPDPVLSD